MNPAAPVTKTRMLTAPGFGGGLVRRRAKGSVALQPFLRKITLTRYSSYVIGHDSHQVCHLEFLRRVQDERSSHAKARRRAEGAPGDGSAWRRRAFAQTPHRTRQAFAARSRRAPDRSGLAVSRAFAARRL